MSKLKKIPKFKNEDAERDFWATHDTTEYFDLSKPVKLDLSKLRPTLKPISLRLPEWLLSELKILSNKRDMAYQSLMKFVLTDWVQKERRAQAGL